jgi:uncharacterized membrane protein YebE (DUF533 family)
MKNCFSNDEMIHFIQLLVAIAKVDGMITDQEIIFLNNYSINSGVDWKKLKEEKIEDILANFKTFSSKIGVIQEIVKLAMIDGNYTENEKSGVTEIAKILLLPDSKVSEIEEWVAKGIKWISEGQSMREDVSG